MRIRFFPIWFVLVLCWSCPSHTDKRPTLRLEGYSLLPPVDFERQLHEQPNALLVDVRHPEEYAAGHLPGAVQIDVQRKEFLQRLQSEDRDRPVFLYCRSGRRSLDAASILQQNGFTQLYELDGGYQAWSTLQGK